MNADRTTWADIKREKCWDAFQAGRAEVHAEYRSLVAEALTSEDEIAHGEAWHPQMNAGLGMCAYCDGEWPCRTQRGIDRLLAALEAYHPARSAHDSADESAPSVLRGQSGPDGPTVARGG